MRTNFRQRLREAVTSIDMRRFLIPHLRRIARMWPPKYQAQKLSRVKRGLYRCADCRGLFGPKEIRMDHISPVVDPAMGFTTWDDYISRLFCSREGYQTLCLKDHDEKTKKERKIRKGK